MSFKLHIIEVHLFFVLKIILSQVTSITISFQYFYNSSLFRFIPQLLYCKHKPQKDHISCSVTLYNTLQLLVSKFTNLIFPVNYGPLRNEYLSSRCTETSQTSCQEEKKTQPARSLNDHLPDSFRIVAVTNKLRELRRIVLSIRARANRSRTCIIADKLLDIAERMRGQATPTQSTIVTYAYNITLCINNSPARTIFESFSTVVHHWEIRFAD